MELSIEQEEAVELASNPAHQIVCVTGQAGTGKTTILKQVYENLIHQFSDEVLVEKRNGEDIFGAAVCLAAPTGRAAVRIQEATGIPAMTIHRMMKFSMPVTDENGVEIPPQPAHDKRNPLPYDAIIVDEASMIDEELYGKVLFAMKKNSVIRFFGDIKQLPPVSGDQKSPFAAALKKYPGAVLTKNYRSDDELIQASIRVTQNKLPIASEQVLIHRTNRGEGSMQAVLKLAKELDVTSMMQQIICPTRANVLGTQAINTQIQTLFNPNKEKLKVFRTEYFRGEQKTLVTAFKRNDKVIWTKNDYEMGLFNGQMGRLIDFDEDNGDMLINFDGRDVKVPHTAKRYDQYRQTMVNYDPRTQIDLGYAITTHRSQGSQFDTIMYVVARSRAATRQNVYTALTRAKTRIVIVNVSGYLSDAIQNNVDIE